jgi:hypothetical protein
MLVGNFHLSLYCLPWFSLLSAQGGRPCSNINGSLVFWPLIGFTQWAALTLIGNRIEGGKRSHCVYCSNSLCKVSQDCCVPAPLKRFSLPIFLLCQVLELYSSFIFLSVSIVRVAHPVLLHHPLWFLYTPPILCN